MPLISVKKQVLYERLELDPKTFSNKKSVIFCFVGVCCFNEEECLYMNKKRYEMKVYYYDLCFECVIIVSKLFLYSFFVMCVCVFFFDVFVFVVVVLKTFSIV
jgi:hypothetical protein